MVPSLQELVSFEIVYMKGETFENGHVTLSNLVLPDCTSALCTTFCYENDNTTSWLQEDVLRDVVNVLLVLHDPKRVVGDAELSSINKQPGWFAVQIKPHTGGFLHAKLLLFRSQSGLRVAVCGSNLYQSQWEHDRDALWVQDFFPYGQSLFNDDVDDDVASVDSREDGSYSTTADSFANALRFFLDDLTQCRERKDTFQVQLQLDDLFRAIDFRTAAARFVFSFPRPSSSTKERGGWHQLAKAMHDLLADATNGNQQEQNNKTASIVYAMSGSVGDLEPDFLLQMQQAMQGITDSSKNPAYWDDVQQMRFLWPSQQTALGMNLAFLMDSGRAIPYKHWETIPEAAKRQNFLDAVPNPTQLGLPQHGCHPFSHAKVMFATPDDNVDTSIVYVGSHNFSKAAWGLRSAMPKNIEAGVVLIPSDTRECKNRLPCLLPRVADLSSANYMPALVLSDIQQVFYSGQCVKAVTLLRDRWLSNTGGSLPQDYDDDEQNSSSLVSDTIKAKMASTLVRVIDLCDSE